MPQKSEYYSTPESETRRRIRTSFFSSLMRYLDRLRYGGKPHGTEHALLLKRRIATIWDQGFDRSPADRSISLPAMFAITREISLALMEGRVALSQLEPEIHDFADILRWIRQEAPEEVRAGRMSWSDIGVRDEISFGVCLLEWGVYYDLLRLNSRQAMLFGDGVMRRMRSERT